MKNTIGFGFVLIVMLTLSSPQMALAQGSEPQSARLRAQVDRDLGGVRRDVESFVRGGQVPPMPRMESPSNPPGFTQSSVAWIGREREVAELLANQGRSMTPDERAHFNTVRALAGLAALINQARELHPGDLVRQRELVRLGVSRIAYFRENAMRRSGVDAAIVDLVQSISNSRFNSDRTTEALGRAETCNCLDGIPWANDWRRTLEVLRSPLSP